MAVILNEIIIIKMVNNKKNKKTPDVVVQNITIRQNSFKTQDLSNWKLAKQSFLNLITPSRVVFYDLIEDIKLDGQIEATWGKRQDSVLNKELLFVKDGKEDEELYKLLNCPDMRRFIKELHNSIAFGFTLIQVNNIYYNAEEEQYHIDFDLIPRKHVHPERNFECISLEQSSASRDIIFKEPPYNKWMIWAGDENDFGLFFKAAQYVIYKRGDFGDWAQYAEMFGMPFREGRYDDYDDKTRIALENAMEAYGGATYAILPKGAEFKIHESSGASGSNTLYDALYKACNSEISKIILGNTLTTDAGDKGTKALGTVHQDAENAKSESDEKMIIDLLNGKFKAILKVFGFNVTGGSVWFKSPEKDWTELKTKWEVISGIKQEVPVADDFIYETFDIPKPDDYELQKTKMAESALNTIQQFQSNPDQNKKLNNIGKRLLSFFE
ncbi:MAG: phage portal protein family protein [Coriobacteriia bacterium]